MSTALKLNVIAFTEFYFPVISEGFHTSYYSGTVRTCEKGEAAGGERR